MQPFWRVIPAIVVILILPGLATVYQPLAAGVAIALMAIFCWPIFREAKRPTFLHNKRGEVSGYQYSFFWAGMSLTTAAFAGVLVYM